MRIEYLHNYSLLGRILYKNNIRIFMQNRNASVVAIADRFKAAAVERCNTGSHYGAQQECINSMIVMPYAWESPFASGDGSEETSDTSQLMRETREMNHDQ